MENRTTPQLRVEEHDTILTGSDFLAGREAQLQARLEEIEAELAGLADVPDDVGRLEQQALDALKGLSDLLKPPSAARMPTPTPVQTMAPPPEARAHGGEGKAGSRLKLARAAGLVVVLLVAALSTFAFVWRYAPELPGENVSATTMATTTSTPMPTPTRPSRSRATATPLPSPTIVAPVIPQARGRDRNVIQAEVVQILETSGTLRLELPLSLMAETVEIVEGMPVLRPVLPTDGAGVHRGSGPFGGAGAVIISVRAEADAQGLAQTRPGDRLAGCNSDGTCHDYEVIAADTWPLARLRQLLASWPMGDEVVLHATLNETSAWVVQAQPVHEEGTR